MVNGSIVLVAKCPIPGKSKTRLIPLLGPEGSSALATAMLKDILQNLTNLVRIHVLYIASHILLLAQICDYLCRNNRWHQIQPPN